ncbi:MAG: helix-turn-helix transcriptional regulator [Lachnospiraceae bacterium]|nr:helix-turn-helix transcriptional regulator [Lachnospiraceae bacterium]
MHRPEYDMKIIGRNLKRLREGKNLSVDEVRKYLQLGSVQAIYKYENGTNYPQADTMFALMELYDADLCDLVCEEIVPRGIGEKDEGDFGDDLEVAFEIENHVNAVNQFRKRQALRLMKYYELYIKRIAT